jgi:hypothetical protein
MNTSVVSARADYNNVDTIMPTGRCHVNLKEKKLENADKEADVLWKKTYETPEDNDEENNLEGSDQPQEDEKIEGDETEEGQPPKPDGIVPDEDESDEEEKPVVTVDWEQKYKTLEGKYNAEVPILHQQLRKTKADFEILSGKIAGYDEKIKNLEKQAKESTSKTALVETDKELETLVTEYPDVGKVIKKVRDAYETRITELENTVNSNLNKKFESVEAEILENKVLAFDLAIVRLGVPDWKELDKKPEFVVWLQEKVPYTNQTRYELLAAASAKFDAETAAKMLIDFKSTLKEADVDEDAETEEVEDDSIEQEKQKKLKKVLAPKNINQGKKPNKGAGVILTKAAYDKFMRETSKGKYDPSKWGGRTEDETEAMFDKAFKEERIQY